MNDELHIMFGDKNLRISIRFGAKAERRCLEGSRGARPAVLAAKCERPAGGEDGKGWEARAARAVSTAEPGGLSS